MTTTTSSKPKPGEAPEPGGPLYETDLYAWSLEQARLLREGRLGEIDAEETMGRELSRAEGQAG